MTIRICFALCLAATLLAGCQQQSEKQPFAPVAPPHRAAAASSSDGGQIDLQLLDYEGIERLVAGHTGQVVVMDAWSLSCAPCVKEFPHLVELQHHFGEDVACISLSFDYEGIGKPEDKLPAVRKFLGSQQATTLDNVLATDESDVLYRKLRLTAVPAVFVYDRSGKLRKRFDNENATREADFFTYQQVSDFVTDLLAEKNDADASTSESAGDDQPKRGPEEDENESVSE